MSHGNTAPITWHPGRTLAKVSPDHLQDVVLTPSNSNHGMDYFSFSFLKNYVFNLFRGSLQHDRIKIIRCVGKEANDSFNIRPLSLSDDFTADSVTVLDENLLATALFDDAVYEVMLLTVKQGFDDRDLFIIKVMGLENDSKKPTQLIEELEKESLFHSSFRNKIILVSENRNQEQSSTGLEIIEMDDSSIHDVFLPVELHNKINLFIQCVLNFEKVKRPLRFLLSGQPGTGKTKLIRAIANSISGKATFLMANGAETKLSALFQLAEKFTPVVLCIDDVDLLVGTREDRSHSNMLGRFLQHLDGFVGSNIFILATTNDKALVDKAASRPGRFDLIIDVQPVSSIDYLKLVKSKTNSENVVSLFDDTVLAALGERNVTGAFIATLVKQLELYDLLQQENLTKELLYSCMNEMHIGFYKTPEQAGKVIGFTG